MIRRDSPCAPGSTDESAESDESDEQARTKFWCTIVLWQRLLYILASSSTTVWCVFSTIFDVIMDTQNERAVLVLYFESRRSSMLEYRYLLLVLYYCTVLVHRNRRWNTKLQCTPTKLRRHPGVRPSRRLRALSALLRWSLTKIDRLNRQSVGMCWPSGAWILSCCRRSGVWISFFLGWRSRGFTVLLFLLGLPDKIFTMERAVIDNNAKGVSVISRLPSKIECHHNNNLMVQIFHFLITGDVTQWTFYL